MVSGRALGFTPLIAMTMGIPCAVVFHQIQYLAKGRIDGVRISYLRLQRQLGPGIASLRWTVQCVKDLELEDFITVERGTGVNRFRIAYDVPKQMLPLLATMLVFPDLAEKVGLLHSVILQQVHLRCHHLDGSFYAAKPLTIWSKHVFPFVSKSTLQRAISHLRDQELMIHINRRGNDGPMQYLRVNYIKLADHCGYQIDEHSGREEAKPYFWKLWVDPLIPTLPTPLLDKFLTA